MTNEELNIAVAEKVMGLCRYTEEKAYGYGPHDTETVWRDKDGWKWGNGHIAFATDIRDAWYVVEETVKRGWSFNLNDEMVLKGWRARFSSYEPCVSGGVGYADGDEVTADDPRPARAICLAALKVVKGEFDPTPVQRIEKLFGVDKETAEKVVRGEIQIESSEDE